MKQTFKIESNFVENRWFFFQWGFSAGTSDLKCHLSTTVFAKTSFWVHASAWISDFLHLSWTKKFKLGGTTGYGDSYLEFLFRQFKVFRLTAILLGAVGAVRGYSGKGAGYYYMIGRGPNSCLPSHVAGLLFCLHVKRFLPSFFNSVDFWSSMSCIVLDTEPADKNNTK